MLKIGYDHQIFSWQKYGGISRYFFELANNIALSASTNVAVISPLYVNSYIKMASNHLRVVGCNVPTIRGFGRLNRRLNDVLSIVPMSQFAPDIKHETYYSTSPNRLKKSKVVLTIFDMIHERFPDSFGLWDRTSKQKYEAVKRADHLICISESTRQDLIDLLDVPIEKTSVVHLGFSLLNQPNVHSPSNEAPYILYVGNRGGYKNFKRFLQAYASVSFLRNNIRLVVYGGGPLNNDELSLIAALGLSKQGVCQVSGGDDLLASMYKHATAFIYPSLYEGFGIPPLEAMSFDCPVVCSNVGSIPEVVGNAGIYFDPYSIDSMAAAIEKLVQDSLLRDQMIARGRERIKFFCWKKCAEETLSIYRNLLI